MEPTVFDTVAQLVTKWLPTITSFVGSFAILATLTPNKTDDRIVQWLLDVVNFLGGNFGKAKNNKDETNNS